MRTFADRSVALSANHYAVPERLALLIVGGGGDTLAAPLGPLFTFRFSQTVLRNRALASVPPTLHSAPGNR